MKIRISLTATAMIVAFLSACGGGGGSGSNAVTSSVQTISGIAATGAPLANASITIKDAAGATITTTTDSSGNYSVPAAGLRAPLVVIASGTSSGTGVNLVTVISNVAAGQSVTANVTPITNAIAGIVVGKDPATADPTSSDGTSITNNLSAAKTQITNSLMPLLTAASVGSSDMLSTSFSADHTGMDKVLDNLAISMLPDGTVKLASSGSVTTNDFQSDGSSTQPSASSLAAGQVVTASSSNLTATLPTLTAPTSLISVSDLLSIQSSFNACFALPSTQRVDSNSNVIASACTSIYPTGYKNNGYTGVQELQNIALISSTSMDGAIFNPPTIIQQLSSNLIKIRISGTLADKSTISFDTIAQSTGGVWNLYGNQRNYYMFINAVADITTQLNPSSAFWSQYRTGFNIYINARAGNGSNIQSVQVTGPGLPGYVDPSNQGTGVLMTPSTSSSCTMMNIYSASVPSSRNKCMSYFKVAAKAVDSTNATALTNSYGPSGSYSNNLGGGMLTDAQLAAIQPLSAYLFKVTLNDNSVQYFIERLRGSLMTPNQISTLHPIQISQQTKDLLTFGSSTYFNTGSSFPVNWVAPVAPTTPAVSLSVRFTNQGTLTFANPKIPVCKAISGVTTCSNTVAAPTGTTFSVEQSSPGIGSDENFVQFIARMPNDMQIFSTYSYDFY